MSDQREPPELDELGLIAEQRAELDALPAEERQAALEYLDRVSLFGSRSRQFFAELAPQLEDFGHLITEVTCEQHGEQAGEKWLDHAMLFSLHAEAAHAIARHDVDAAVYFNGLTSDYRDKLARRRQDHGTD